MEATTFLPQRSLHRVAELRKWGLLIREREGGNRLSKFVFTRTLDGFDHALAKLIEPRPIANALELELKGSRRDS